MPKIIPMPGRAGKVVAERDQMSHGRLIHVVSVFPRTAPVRRRTNSKRSLTWTSKIPTQLRKGVDKPPRQR